MVIEVPDELGQKVIEQFGKARFDARGFIEETPAAFKRLVFKKIVELKSLGPEVMEKAVAEIPSIKDDVAKEDKELPVPDIDISDVLELQKIQCKNQHNKNKKRRLSYAKFCNSRKV